MECNAFYLGGNIFGDDPRLYDDCKYYWIMKEVASIKLPTAYWKAKCMQAPQ